MSETSYWERITKSRLSRRRALTGAAAAGFGAAALSVIGCGGGGDGGGGAKKKLDPNEIRYSWQLDDESKDAREGGTLVTPSSNDITGGLDPSRSRSFTTLAVASVSYEELLLGNTGPGIEPASPEGRKINGGLAESYEVSSDATRFTFKLRPNVKFHNLAPVNGRVMDVDDWKVSYERNLDSPLLGANLKQTIENVTFPDTRTMVITTKEPNVGFLRTLVSGSASFYIMPKEVLSNEDLFDKRTIGTAQRMLTSVQPSIGREYKRHPDYWRGKPLWEGFSVPIIPEVANQRAQFVTGNSIGYTPPQTDVLLLQKDYPKGLMLKGDPAGSYRTNFFGFRDFETSPWGDARVRIAMRMGVDWKAVRSQFGNLAEFEAADLKVESRLPTHVKAGGIGYPYWLNPEEGKLGDASKNFLFDAAEAKKLLSAAGVANGFEIDGYMNGGTEYGTSVYPELVQVTMDQWKANLNINVKLNRPPYAEFLPKIYQQRDYKGICIQQPEFTYNEIGQELFNWFHSKGQRFKSIKDSRVDDLVERQQKELDDNKRTAIIHDFQKYMAEKMYSVPGDGVSGGFGFIQPWYKNYAWPEYKRWLDDKSKYA